MTIIFIAAFAGYLLGSIPSGFILAQLAGYGDIRKIGSGNIGATNILRTGNRYLALAVLLLDGGKGAIAVLLAARFGGYEASLAAGLFSILGHMFPVWLKFRGGKGVATSLGMLLALAPTVGIATCILWLLTALIFRISSLSALIALFSAPALAHFLYSEPNLTGICALIFLLVWFKHRANIRRLLTGEEPKIGKRSS
ncbi:MAG: acyl-phosphate glycerol 3-phosphate acyltransferase [Alphaproteobacteria bacterium CG_4_9_14_3_um_filter_47_13]|nr:MAG: acyl-phosphate glycerol 3-phosphate acyltransferase [Alphaproteobacteria bacterium CG_4_9_14_3_um_filter_47_13]